MDHNFCTNYLKYLHNSHQDIESCRQYYLIPKKNYSHIWSNLYFLHLYKLSTYYHTIHIYYSQYVYISHLDKQMSKFYLKSRDLRRIQDYIRNIYHFQPLGIKNNFHGIRYTSSYYNLQSNQMDRQRSMQMQLSQLLKKLLSYNWDNGCFLILCRWSIMNCIFSIYYQLCLQIIHSDIGLNNQYFTHLILKSSLDYIISNLLHQTQYIFYSINDKGHKFY